MANTKYYLSNFPVARNDSVELAELDATKAIQAADSFWAILRIEECFAMMAENYFELECDALSHTVRTPIAANLPEHEVRASIYHLGRRVTNLLGTCRAFLDRTPHMLRENGCSAEEHLAAFHDCRRSEHSRSFSYRFLEALRNYVQHRGESLNGLSHGISWIDPHDRPKGAINTLALRIRISKLVDDAKFDRRVARELPGEAKNDQIDIRPHMRSYVSSMARVLAAVRQSVEDEYRCSKNFLDDTVGKFSPAGKAFRYLVSLSSDGVGTSYYLSTSADARRQDIISRYKNLRTAESHTVSSGTHG